MIQTFKSKDGGWYAYGSNGKTGFARYETPKIGPFINQEEAHAAAGRVFPEFSSPEYKIKDTAARLLALGRITESPSDETVRRWCRQGRFPGAHKKEGTRGQGGEWRIPEADLLRFVKPVRGPKGPRRKG